MTKPVINALTDLAAESKVDLVITTNLKEAIQDADVVIANT